MTDNVNPPDTTDLVLEARRIHGVGGRLPAAVRRNLIKEIVRKDGFISVTGIAEKLGVSAMSVRRDLDSLASSGDLVRSHGAALAVPQSTGTERSDFNELQYATRRRRNAQAKEAIARRALELIKPGDMVALDVGSSVLALARELVKESGVRVFTNHLRVASLLADSRNEVIMPGGMVRSHEMSLCGAQTVEQVREHWFSSCFIGVSGLCSEGGFDYSYDDSQIKRAYIERSEQVVVLCDVSKFECKSTVKVFGLNQVHVLVSDSEPSEAFARELDRQKVKVILA